MRSETQNRKLRKLARYLDTIVDEKKFNMNVYLGNTNETFEYPAATEEVYHNCGTSACALGHAPFLFPAKEGEQWEDYTKRVFGMHPFTRHWHWMFSTFWSRVDNTPQGAAKRIRYWCRNKVPEKFLHNILDSYREFGPNFYKDAK